jgi:hypothetical protein
VRARSTWTTVGTAAGVAVAVVAAGFLLLRAVLPPPPHASNAALRAASWLERYRLVDSTFAVKGGPTVHGTCLQDWFTVDGHRRRGALLTLDDGFRLLDVPPHTLIGSGGTAADRAASPLVLLELAGCPRVLARRVQTLAQQRRGLTLAGEKLAFDLDATRVTLSLAPASGMPTAVSIVSRSTSGAGRIRFRRVTPGTRQLLLQK